MEKKKKWMIFGGTAVVVVGVFLCIAAFFLYKGVTLFFDREIVADQYLEQMTSAASQGDRDAMRSLYMPGAVPKEHMERQIQENVDIWGKSQLDSFKKKGLNIRTSTNTTANSLSGVFPLFWYNKEKGADTMMNPTMLDPIALAA